MTDIAIYVFYDFLNEIPFAFSTSARFAADAVKLLDGSTVSRHALTWAIGTLDDYDAAAAVDSFAGFASAENDFQLPDYFDSRYAITTGGIGETVRLAPGARCDEIFYGE